MSSVYRTTVISDRDNWSDYWISDTLPQASHLADQYASLDDEVKIDEVIQDACGEYMLLYPVLEYVRDAS
jgi:hypothetical protein